jgi:hypothetical protein
MPRGKMLPLKWKKYNLELAIQARIVLMKEMHPKEEREELVWLPTDKALKDFAKNKPKFLLCFHGPIFIDRESLGTGATFCDLYAIASDNKVVYIGTLLDKKQTEANWLWLLNVSEEPEIRELKRKGKMAPVRYKIRCYIPSPCFRLTRRAMEKGIRLFLRTFVPEMSGVKIKWLGQKEQDVIEGQIRKEAEERAWPQTRQEKREIDLLERRRLREF